MVSFLTCTELAYFPKRHAPNNPCFSLLQRKMKSITVVSGIILSMVGSKAFTPSQTVSRCKSQLNFGIPNFSGGAGGEEKNKEAEKKKGKSNEEEKKIGLGGLMQMVAMGMGSPFLGDFEGVDEETGKMMFSLEANNLVDEVSH